MTCECGRVLRDLPAGWQATFGAFRIVPVRKQLLLGDRVIRLGGRAYDLLQLLVENAGEFVSKRALFDRAWPRLSIDETNLRTAIAALRRALREDGSGRSYIETDPGRGYRLSAQIVIDSGKSITRSAPKPRSRVIGRELVVTALADEYPQRKLVTIVGPGGIGKTTTALLIAQQLIDGALFDAVTLVDFSSVHDPKLAASTIRSALDLTGELEDDWEAICLAVTHQSRLLVLDSCESVLPTLGAELPDILERAPGLAVLATSREPLGAQGELVWRLDPLSTPALYLPLTVDQALRYSAVELFKERASAAVSGFQLTLENIQQVAEICRRLDGLPLAIELAAGRIDGLDVSEMATELTDYFRLHMPGRSTAPLRHRTLQATLDWSYDALRPCEQILLRRLSVFCGTLTAETVRNVVSDDLLAASQVASLMRTLGTKSLLSAGPDLQSEHYVFLGTTRAYALERLQEAGETEIFVPRHARFVIELIRSMTESTDRAGSKWLIFCARTIDEVRCALEWLLGQPGMHMLALELVLVALPLWQSLGLGTECLTVIARLRSTRDFEATAGDMLRLAMTRCTILMNRVAGSEDLYESWMEVSDIAGGLADPREHLRAIYSRFVAAWSQGRLQDALGSAVSLGRAAQADNMDRFEPVADVLVAMAQFQLGNFTAADGSIERALRAPDALTAAGFELNEAFDLVSVALTRRAFMQAARGDLAGATAIAASNLERAIRLRHDATICHAIGGVSAWVAIEAGDLDTASRLGKLLAEHATRAGLDFWRLVADCIEAVAEESRIGKAAVIGTLQQLAGRLHQTWYGTIRLITARLLARALLDADRPHEAQIGLDEAIAYCLRTGERWCYPVLLATRAEARFKQGGANYEVFETEFSSALDMAQRAGANQWADLIASTMSRCKQA